MGDDEKCSSNLGHTDPNKTTTSYSVGIATYEGTAMISGISTSPIHFPDFEKNSVFHLRADLPHYFPNTRVVGIEI